MCKRGDVVTYVDQNFMGRPTNWCGLVVNVSDNSRMSQNVTVLWENGLLRTINSSVLMRSTSTFPRTGQNKAALWDLIKQAQADAEAACNFAKWLKNWISMS